MAHLRQHTIEQAADELGLPVTTLRKWSTYEGAPFDKIGKGKPSKCDPEELTNWAESRNLTGKTGRPKASPLSADDLGGDDTYWLARWRRAKTLKEEGSVIARDEHTRIVSHLAAVSVSELRALPAAMAGSLYGRTPQEIEKELERYIDGICDRLSDPASYDGDGFPGDSDEDMGEAVEAVSEAEAE
jgi:hypothetical protein